MTALAHRLRRLAGTYEQGALAAIRKTPGTREAELGIQLALHHLAMAASYHQAATENEEQD